eukprot:scaffold11474_cov114-Isochrysis_galbana.AAC.3
MPGRTARVSSRGDSTFVRSARAAHSRLQPGSQTPALLTSRSTRRETQKEPKAAVLPGAAASNPAPYASALRPREASSAAAAEQASVSRPARMTHAPSSASRHATARPMPRFAPVTAAVAPVKRIRGVVRGRGSGVGGEETPW